MASTSMPADQPLPKPSFAKVAASAYKPQSLNETQAPAKPVMGAPAPPVQSANHSAPNPASVPQVHVDGSADNALTEQAGNTATRTGQWATSTSPQVAFGSGSKEEDQGKARPSITLVKSLVSEDNTTQLSSSDGSAKPPSLDGKSVASATTFALDEKESIRPDDSASLRAVEEEDVASPPDSVAASSRVGSDSGARAFRDQLQEIAVMGPAPHRAAPPGRMPNLNNASTHTLYDPNQPPNGIGRPISQPLVHGMPNATGPPAMPAIPDEKLIEALESPRDRLFVLKLEQDFIDFIKDSRENEFALPNCNTFYRMLAHRLADYYLLGHVVDGTMTGVKITRTPYNRIPPPLSSLPVSSKVANTPPVDLPVRKIMRRGDDGKSGTNTTANSEGPSKTTSEAGAGSGSDNEKDGNDADSNKDKSAMTREQREARYKEVRERIFGSAESGDVDAATENVGPTEDKDASRSSSASGKKKNKKQRNYDDDGFEARSRFTSYYNPQQYPVQGYGPDPGAMYYGAYPGQMQTPQYQGMATNVSPPPTFNAGYPNMMPQDAQSQYGWPQQQYQSPNGAMGYPGYGAVQNGYDLSAGFERGMQSFQSAGMPSQATPKLANAPMASYPDGYAQPTMQMNPGWPQMSPQTAYGMGQSAYAQNGPGTRPVSAPIQNPMPGAYPYGQYPSSPYNGGAPSRHPHPLPGSYNRQQFNPQSQTFVPGGRNIPFQMQQNMPQMAPQGMNNYGGYQMSAANQVSNQIPRPSPSVPQPQAFDSPRISHNGNGLPLKATSSHPSQPPPSASAQAQPPVVSSASSTTSSIPAQSSIAKYGAPAHLPPKPPPPAQPQPPKFNLPGHNFSTTPRLPNAMTTGYNGNVPMIRGGSGAGMPGNPS